MDKFDEIWKQVKGLPDTAMLQVPGALSASTKQKLSRRSAEEIARIVSEAIDEVNKGSIKPLEDLIRKRL